MGGQHFHFRCEQEVCHGIDLHKQPFSELISEIKKNELSVHLFFDGILDPQYPDILSVMVMLIGRMEPFIMSVSKPKKQH